MALLTYFEVTGSLLAIVSDASSDEDGQPQEQPISSTVTFTPSVKEVRAEGKIIRLQPIRARTVETGELVNIDDTTVELLADTFGVGLTYRVDFSDVTYDKMRNQRVEPFRFAAPTDATPVDIATVERVEL
ncbi:hypothetical protein PBI_GAIA_168 [Mycobacterium phage Gaia]|uniref:Uncharacterized protein n=1 Tax=Mycobacterium phage Gaia TaxID=1486472 RepID=A0A068F2M6_9CAUD|nr:tail protein [Mycobacterium phage Gaia]AID58984.1 hypothetical protein PBI_GAIA_168 [Mycobacterium phage Gaia]